MKIQDLKIGDLIQYKYGNGHKIAKITYITECYGYDKNGNRFHLDTEPAGWVYGKDIMGRAKEIKTYNITPIEQPKEYKFDFKVESCDIRYNRPYKMETYYGDIGTHLRYLEKDKQETVRTMRGAAIAEDGNKENIELLMPRWIIDDNLTGKTLEVTIKLKE